MPQYECMRCGYNFATREDLKVPFRPCRCGGELVELSLFNPRRFDLVEKKPHRKEAAEYMVRIGERQLAVGFEDPKEMVESLWVLGCHLRKHGPKEFTSLSNLIIKWSERNQQRPY